MRKDRIGRNNKCPCGSGLKYKKCCLDSSSAIVDDEDILKILQAIDESTRKPELKICMHPEKDKCSEKIIKAHSIHRKGILNKISKNGKVLMLERGKVNLESFELGLSEVGNKKATTFRNFCEHHDKVFFQEIEDRKYEETEKQNFIYAFRVYAMEWYKKQVNYDVYLKLLKQYKNSQQLCLHLTQVLYMIDIALKELQYEGNILTQAITSKKYGCLDSIVLTLDFEIKLAVSTLLELNFDLQGNRLNDHSDLSERVRKIYFNVFPANGKTYILLSWLKEDSDFFVNLKSQLLALEQHELINFLNNVIPSYTEHFAINPDIWSSQSDESKTFFIDSFLNTMIEDVMIDLLGDSPYSLCK